MLEVRLEAERRARPGGERERDLELDSGRALGRGTAGDLERGGEVEGEGDLAGRGEVEQLGARRGLRSGDTEKGVRAADPGVERALGDALAR